MTNHPNRARPLYPDVDAETSGYVVQIRYDMLDWPTLTLPGRHDNFRGARDRARRVAASMIAGGEIGLYGRVTFTGEKPADFPRNGVKA